MSCKLLNRISLKNQRLQNQLNALQSKYDELLELFNKAQADLYSPKTETVKKNPFNEAEVSADLSKPEPDGTVDEDSEVKQQDKQSKQTGKAGRKAIAPDLPRVVTEYHLPDETCPCCQNSLHSMKTIVTEQLDIVPKHISVKRFIQHVYTCRSCHQNGTTTIINAPMPVAPIKGSIASPSTLAVVLTAKYVDGLPLYRMAAEFQRSGLNISRTTLANWVMRSASVLTPIFNRLKTYLLSEPLIHGDETRLQVLKEAGKKAQSQSYMWVYRSGEHSKTPVVLFEYQPNRSGDNPTAFLSGRSGTLMSDGDSAWRMLKGVKSLGCFAHARRKFNDVVKIKGNHCAEAQKAIDMIGQLYKIAKECAESALEKRYEARQTNALSILNEFKVWLKDKAINEVALCCALISYVYLQLYSVQAFL